MIFDLFVTQCFKKSWLTKITQMKLFYQKYLPVKISPAKVPLNCRITLAKKAFKQVWIQCGKTSKLTVDPQHYLQCCKGIEKIKIKKRKKSIESDLIANNSAELMSLFSIFP